MDENSRAISAVEDSSAFTQSINLSGDISKTLYLAMHPEEDDEAPGLIVFKKAGGGRISANAGPIEELPNAA